MNGWILRKKSTTGTLLRPIFGKEDGGNTSGIMKKEISDMTRDFAYCSYTIRKIWLEQLVPFVKSQGEGGRVKYKTVEFVAQQWAVVKYHIGSSLA